MADIANLLKAVLANKKEKTKLPKNKILDILTDITEQTEGLLPGQTPLRITNENMRKWKTIQGIPVIYPEDMPKDRNNFFWVAPGMEKEVIKRQWKSYFKNPAKFGLTDKSTLKDIIKVFDQTNPKNKIKLLERMNIDPESKLNEFDVSSLQPDNSQVLGILNQILGNNQRGNLWA